MSDRPPPRGDYRAIHTVLVESPEFIDLSPEAQLVFFHLKLRLGATGIDVLPAAEAVISEATGYDIEAVRRAIAELCAQSPSDGIGNPLRMGWVRRERHVFWIRNALRFEPSRTLSNENHRKNVVAHLAGLPKLAICNDFADYYDLPRPFPEQSPTPSPSEGIPDHGDGVTEERSNGYGEALSPRPRAREPDELDGWLGEYADVVADCPVVTADVRYALYQHFGPPALRANAWKKPDGTSVSSGDRPRLLTLALTGYAAEGRTKIESTNQFAAMLRRAIADETSGPAAKQSATYYDEAS